MGWRHGVSCLGRCWALMALMAQVKKLLPWGQRLAVLLGLVLIAVGVVRFAVLAP